MSLANFFIIGGGGGASDINAGSSQGAAQATTTNGSWNAGTGVFIASSGTPFASTVVGDYASVYVDGATVTTFVGKVTLVTSNVNITIDVTTVKYGVAPTTLGTTRSCTINGAWNSPNVISNNGIANGSSVGQATKINIKNATYSIGANATYNLSGTVTLACWFSGYNTTPGDLDNDTTNTLAKPIFNCASTVTVTFSGNQCTWSGLDFEGTVNGNFIAATPLPADFVRCRFNNTNAGASAGACNDNGGSTFSYCWFKHPTTGNARGVITSAGGVKFGCVFEAGGLTGIECSGDTNLINCVGLNNTGIGFQFDAGVHAWAFYCTVAGASSDGIRSVSAVAGSRSAIIGCLLTSCGGWGINFPGANNINACLVSNNDFFSCSSGNVNGFIDAPVWFGQTESSNPVTSSTDITPVPGAGALLNGFAAVFENQVFSNKQNIGAVGLTKNQANAGPTAFIYGG